MACFQTGLAGKSAAGAAVDPVTRSLRFDYNTNHYLVFDPTTTYDSQTVYTFSCWAKLGQLPSANTNIFTAGFYTTSTNQNYLYFRINADRKLNVALRHNSVNTNYTANDGGILRDPSAWYHLMFSRNANVLKLYINNVEVLSDSTVSTTQKYGIGSNDPMHIGTSLKPTSSSINNFESFDGLLADIHFIDGHAKVPADFIEDAGYGAYKPKAYTGAFGTNGFHIDAQPAHDADLLVTSVSRSDGDTTFVDAAKGHTITTNGDPEHSIAVGNPFTGDGRAIKFGGTNPSLTTSNSTDLAIASGDSFTAECWVYINNNASNTYDGIFSGYLGSTNTGWSIEIDGGDWGVYDSGGGRQKSSTAATTGKWHHVALVKTDSTTNGARLYLNGNKIHDVTISSNITSARPITLGAYYASDGYSMDGYMFDARFTKGEELYTGSTYTVPASALEKGDNTKLLIQPDKDDSSIEDKSDSGHTISTNGTLTYTASTPYDAAAKSTAMYLDGSGDRVMANHSSDFNFGTGAFTIEMWHKHISSVNGSSGSSNVTGDIVISKGKWHTSTTGWLLKTVNYGTDVLNFDMYMGDGSFSNQVNLVANSSGVATVHDGGWHHIAITRDGSGNMGLFVDGTRVDDETGTGYNFDVTNYGLRMGAVYGYDNAESNYANCYLYDVRVTKGEAKYDPTSASVTKPSAPFELNPIYIGADQSGNKNHFTPTGISGHDVMRDTPTTNFCTFSPISGPPRGTSTTISEGNLKVVGGYSGTYFMRVMGTVAVSSGKWFYEVRCGSTHTNSREYGFKGVNTDWPVGSHGLAGGSNEWSTRSEFAFSAYHGGIKFSNSSSPTTNNTSWGSDGDVIGLALDLDSSPRTLRVFKDGSEVGSATDIPTGGSTEWLPCIDETSYGPQTSVANFGQDPTFGGLESGTTYTSDNTTGVVGEFHNPIPSGYLPFAAGNLPDPTVTTSDHFDTLIWQGDGVDDRDITGLGFDATDGALTWIKNRSDSGAWHVWFDSVRGAGHQIATNRTDTELPSSSNTGGKVSQWNTDGFRLKEGSGTTPDKSTNELNDNYVSYNWKAHQGGPVTRSHTMTLEVNDLWGSGSDWGSTKLEVWEGATKLKDITQPAYIGGSSTTWTIKTNDTDKIKVVWDVDSSMDWTAMYAVLKDSSNNTLASWDGNSYGGGSTPSDGSNFYIPSSGYDSSDAAVTGVVESSSPTVESYNSAAGFTIIKYAGDGANDDDTQTLDHSLGVPLEFVIVKGRTNNDSMDSGEWVVWHKDLSSGNFLRMNSTAAQDSESYGNTLIATATSGSQHRVVVNNGYANTSGNGHYLNSGPANGTGDDYILYGWAGVEGYSKFGKYTGGSDPFIYTGFKVGFWMVKRIDSSGHWTMFDSARDTHNLVDHQLEPNYSNAESSGSTKGGDFLSNGFKVRSSQNEVDASGGTYVYAAFSESPFSKSNAR